LAKKNKSRKVKREPTRHQISKWQQQKKRQRIIFTIGIVIIVAVVAITLVGWYFSQYQPLHETAIKVNDAEFDMSYFIDTLEFHGKNQSPEFMQHMTDSIVDDIVQNELIRQAAMELGITASSDEIREKLKEVDFPNDRAHRDIASTWVITGKLQDEYFEQQVPTATAQVHIMAMLLESERQALEATDRLESGEDFATLAGELSVNELTRQKQGDPGWHPESILKQLLYTSVPVEYAATAEVGALSEPLQDEQVIKEVGYWLVKISEWDEENDRAHAHAILLGSEEEAQDVKARLEAGEDFATLAEELSQWYAAKSNKGDLNWVTEGSTTPVLDEVIFNDGLELETLTGPVRDDTTTTRGGYWLVKVDDRDDNRQIDETDREFMKAKALQDWVDSLWDDPDNLVDDSFLDDEKIAWAVDEAMKSLRKTGGS